jgi:hypothetical protein
MNTIDTLSEEDMEQFYRIKHLLYLFADKKLNVLMHKSDWKDVGNNKPEEILKLRDYVFKKNIKVIGEFIEQNPYGLKKEDLEILESWKKPIIGDKYVLFKHTKEYSLFFGEDNVYGVIGLMDSFNVMFGGDSFIFVDLIILPFKDRLTHEGLFLPYNISIGKSMRDGILAEAEEIIMKKGIITSSLNKQEKESSEEDLLRYYMKSEKNQEFFWEKIEKLKKKSANLKAIYNYEVGRINSRHIKKQLKLQNLNGYFAVLFSQVIASGRTKKELEENMSRILPKERLIEIYEIKI